MANQRKSGLGRGLSSLLGESMGETNQQPEAPREPVFRVPPEPATQVDRAETPKPVPVSTTVSEEAVERATIKERPASATPVQASPKRESTAAEKATRKAVVQGDVAKPKPYVEEDDHATIKEVVVRETRSKGSETELPIDDVEPNPDQPRTNFNKSEIEELARSIEREGLLQPILVRKTGAKYQIIAGERRWQACKQAGLNTIPVRIKDVEDDKALELALIENIQRSDLNPIEEAYGYKRLMERQGMTQADVAQAVSKGRSTIANALRLLDLPESAQQLLFEDKITAGHARAILSVPTSAGREKLTEKLKEEKLSVRETETLARLYAGQAQNKETKKTREPIPPAFKKAARELRERLSANVRIKTVGGKNKIEIEFSNEAELMRIFDKIIETKEG